MWRRRKSKPQEEANDEDLKVTQPPRRSDETYRKRPSHDVESGTRPRRRSIYSKDTSYREDFELRNGTRRVSGDLERGNVVSIDYDRSRS